MAVVINGDTGISPVTASGTSASVDGMTVGRGGGEVATNTAVGASALAANTTGALNTAIGYEALVSNTTADASTATGYRAAYVQSTGALYTCAFGYRASYSNSSGAQNNAFGFNCLFTNTAGSNNSGFGTNTLQYTTGSYNTGIGNEALRYNTTASRGTAVGYQAGYANTASDNTFVGYLAGTANTTGGAVQAFGNEALKANTTGSHNVATGYAALTANTTGQYNTATGSQALQANTTASNNTAVGYQAGYTATTNISNCFIGAKAGYAATGANNTYVGAYNSGGNGSGSAMTSGNSNTILGGYTGNQSFLDMRTLSNYVVLSDGDGNARQIINSSGQLLFGTTGATNAFYNRINIWEATSTQTGIYMQKYNQVEVQIGFKSGTNTDFFIGTGSTTLGTYGVYLANSGTSWVSVSDERQKDIIEPIEDALTKINTFRTVIGKYKHDTNNVRRPFLIAQDVQAVFPEAVKVQEDEEALLGLAYTDVIPLLVAAIKELKAEFDAYKATHP
jgi:hypothetical protein